MNSRMDSLRGLATLIFLLIAALAQPCFAARWQELGNADNSLDKVYIDADSVEQMDGFRIVRVMTVYPAPRPNSHNITMDSHIQKDAFDCGKKQFYGIQLIGYLNGQQVGTGPVAVDWKTKMLPVNSNPLSQLLLSTACSLPLTSGEKKAPVAASPGIQQPAPARSPLLDGENLLFAPPKDFKFGFHSDRNGSLTEYVPNGQTVDDWTEMLTVQVFPDLKEMEPAAFLQKLGAKWLNDCPETPKDSIRNGQANGYPVSMLELKCPNVHATGKPESTVFRVIKGKDALYSVQHAWRTAPSVEAKDSLSKTNVCDTRDPSHPCPSFDTLTPPAQAEVKPKISTGSGIIVNEDGDILTNAHVVKSCKSITVKPLNGDALPATLEAIDSKNDLALIKTTAGYGKPAQFRLESKPAKLGETIGVIGYPLTGFLSAEPKATFGQINSVAGAGKITPCCKSPLLSSLETVAARYWTHPVTSLLLLCRKQRLWRSFSKQVPFPKTSTLQYAESWPRSSCRRTE